MVSTCFPCGFAVIVASERVLGRRASDKRADVATTGTSVAFAEDSGEVGYSLRPLQILNLDSTSGHDIPRTAITTGSAGVPFFPFGYLFVMTDRRVPFNEMSRIAVVNGLRAEFRMPGIKMLLAEGKIVRMFGVGQLMSTKLIEIVGEHGEFDALWIDSEHAGLGMKDIELATMAARAYGMDHFVRMPATDYASIMRVLEAGAGGVMVSMVKTPEDADQAVRWAKFWPRGERGMNGGNRDGRFGLTPLAEYVKTANAATFVGIQIETASALASVAEIAAVPDVDLLFVGPADISQVMGVPGDFENPKCLDAIEKIARACADAGKPWGIVPRGGEYAERMRGWGCRMFVLGFDHHAVHAGIRATKERYGSFFEAR